MANKNKNSQTNDCKNVNNSNTQNAKDNNMTDKISDCKSTVKNQNKMSKNTFDCK